MPAEAFGEGRVLTAESAAGSGAGKSRRIGQRLTLPGAGSRLLPAA